MATDELAEARAERERAEQAEAEAWPRWVAMAQRAVDVVMPAVMEALRAVGWELIEEDLLGDNPYLHPLVRGLGFRVPDSGDEFAVGVLFEVYSRKAVRFGEGE